VDRSRDELLPGSRLTLDQHRRCCRRDDGHLLDDLVERRAATDNAVWGVASNAFPQVVVFELELLLEPFDLLQRSRMGDRDCRVVGKRAKPGERALVTSITIEHAEYAQDLALEDQRLPAKAADALTLNPIGVSDPLVIAFDIVDEDAIPSRADAANLPDTKWESPERSVQARPIAPAIQGHTGTRRQMKASSVIGAFSAKRARLADVARLNQPHASERHSGVRNEPLDDLREDAINRRLRCDRQGQRLQGFWVHGSTLQQRVFVDATTIVRCRSEMSLQQPLSVVLVNG
jgi:hypothetical protein